MNFNITEYQEFINMVSGSTLQLTIKKLSLSLFEFWFGLKEECSQWIWKSNQMPLPFPIICMCATDHDGLIEETGRTFCLLLSQSLKRSAKMQVHDTLLTKFYFT